MIVFVALLGPDSRRVGFAPTMARPEKDVWKTSLDILPLFNTSPVFFHCWSELRTHLLYVDRLCLWWKYSVCQYIYIYMSTCGSIQSVSIYIYMSTCGSIQSVSIYIYTCGSIQSVSIYIHVYMLKYSVCQYNIYIYIYIHVEVFSLSVYIYIYMSIC